MTSAQETLEAIQKALEPYIRPREEAEHIRRVLALHLRSCHENGAVSGSLALVDSKCTIKPSPEVRGLQREYLKALNANIKAKKAYETVGKQHNQKSSASDVTSATANASNRLEEYLTTIKLQKKQARLQTVEKYLDLLGQKPAASADFLEPEQIFKDAVPLPEVPRDVVNGFAVNKDSAKTDIKALVDQLEKAVLRSKLLLKKEEKLFEEVKSRSSPQPGEFSDGAKLAALSTTRNELISWIETELGKASGVDESDLVESNVNAKPKDKVDQAHMDERLVLIKSKYVSYLAARKALIELVSQSPRPSIKPPEADRSTTQASSPPATSATHLISPYIEKLLSLTHEQKSSIAQKSHLNTILAKQMKETCQTLDHLADESQLLPAFPMAGSLRRKQGFSSGLLRSESSDVTSGVKPWVFAADSSKIATLEAVAGKIEEGQNSLEASTKSLDEMDTLLGRNIEQSEEILEADASTEDIWLVETQLAAKDGAPGRPMRVRNEKSSKSRDIWSVLDGTLGLINAEDSPRK